MFCFVFFCFFLKLVGCYFMERFCFPESHCRDQRSQYLHWSFSPDTAKHKGNAFPLVTSEICRKSFQPTSSHRTTRIPQQSLGIKSHWVVSSGSAHTAGCSPKRRPFIQQLRRLQTAAFNIHFPARNRRMALQRSKGSDSVPLRRLAQQINKSDTPLLELILWIFFFFTQQLQ